MSYEEYFCSFCDQYFSRSRFVFHISFELFFLFLIIVKYSLWAVRILPTLSDFETSPCKECKHSAYWHVLKPEATDAAKSRFSFAGPFTAFYIFMNLSFMRPEIILFTMCIKCGLVKSFKDIEDNHEYVRPSNLEYLESKYEKI